MQNMDNNLNRLATFRSWPSTSPVSVLALASDGFFFTEIEDEVECYSCHIKIRNWKTSDSVPGRHKQLSGQCELVRKGQAGSLTNSPTSSITHSLEEDGSGPGIESDDAVDGNVEVLRPNIQTDSPRTIPQVHDHTDSPIVIRSNADVLQVMSQSNEDTQNWFSTRQISESHSTNVDYTARENRLASFNGRWSVTAPVTVAELVFAGLFYTGPGDRVQCAYCRGGLYNWVPGDTAVGEHVRYFPHCKFAKEKLAELLGKPDREQRNGRLTTKAISNTGDEEWTNAPAVKIAQGMGFHLELIKKAAEKVLACSCKPMSSDTLMDAIFEIESSTRDGEQSDIGSDSEAEVSLQEVGAVGGEDILQETKNLPEIGSENTIAKVHDKGRNLVESSPNTNQINDEEVKKLIEENTRLRGNTTCKVCLDASVDTLFLPCRHLVCCEDCASAVKSCPLCRTVIVGTVKTFLS